MIKFLLSKGAVITKMYRFVKYQPDKCFESFVQSVVDARRAGDENTESAVQAETMKLLGNSSYGYQIMNRKKHKQVSYVEDINVHQRINKASFYSCNEISSNLFEIVSTKNTIRHKEPIVLGFFILQYAKLRMLELYYNFLDRFCDVSLFEELEMDTDSLYLALGKPLLVECIRGNMLPEWNYMRANDHNDNFTADSMSNFLPRTCCHKHAKYDKRTQGLFKTEFRATSMICLCSKTYFAWNDQTHESKLSSKGLNKRFIDEPAAKYAKVLDEQTNEVSLNRGFRVIDNSIQTYMQEKRGLAYFYPKRIVASDGIHTQPLLL
jgi:hypothetical protein